MILIELITLGPVIFMHPLFTLIAPHISFAIILYSNAAYDCITGYWYSVSNVNSVLKVDLIFPS